MSTVVNPFIIPATSGGGDFEVVPAGNHRGVLVALVDVGTHWESFAGKAPKPVRKIQLHFELVDEKNSKGTNHIIGAEYSVAGSPKASIRLLMSKWRGKDYGETEEINLLAALGKSCLVNVANTSGKNDKTYANLAGVSRLPKGMEAGTPTHKPFAWFIGSGEKYPNPDWLPYVFGQSALEKMNESDELKGEHAPSNEPGDQDDDGGDHMQGSNDDTIPF